MPEQLNWRVVLLITVTLLAPVTVFVWTRQAAALRRKPLVERGRQERLEWYDRVASSTLEVEGFKESALVPKLPVAASKAVRKAVGAGSKVCVLLSYSLPLEPDPKLFLEPLQQLVVEHPRLIFVVCSADRPGVAEKLTNDAGSQRLLFVAGESWWFQSKELTARKLACVIQGDRVQALAVFGKGMDWTAFKRVASRGN